MNEILKNKVKSEILAEKIKELHYGDIITHSQIALVIEEEYSSNRYRATIAKAKKLLLKDGICLESIIGDGYRIIEPDDFVTHSLKHYKRGFTEMKKGYDTLAYAPTRNMTPEGLDAYRRVHDRAITLTAAMKGVSVELKALGKKRHPMQIENVNRA